MRRRCGSEPHLNAVYVRIKEAGAGKAPQITARFSEAGTGKAPQTDCLVDTAADLC